MTAVDSRDTERMARHDILRIALIAVICEKIMQHILVTIAFWINAGGIRSTVAVDPDLLMDLGALAALLFILSLWGLLTRKWWTPDLLLLLALFDIVGEFVAQGKLAIVVTLSFLVAVLLLILTLMYRRQIGQRSG